MMTRQFLIRSALGAGLLALGLAGCALNAPSKGETFSAQMSAAQEVPPNASTGTGAAEVSVDPGTLAMTYKVTYTGLTGPATVAHIHGPAPAGANAGPVVPIANPASPIQGQVTLTAAQYAELKAGRMYVNVHTAANPGGEIRGQLTRR